MERMPLVCPVIFEKDLDMLSKFLLKYAILLAAGGRVQICPFLRNWSSFEDTRALDTSH